MSFINMLYLTGICDSVFYVQVFLYTRIFCDRKYSLIFSCRFRFLRNSDRDRNKESYPALNYPELYLLHGGYKTFFERHSDKCEPCAYRPMLDPDHETDLRHFRSKSKSWNGDSKSRLALRNNLKRLGL